MPGRSPARTSIEGLFGRLESLLHSKVYSLGQPRAACLAFAAALLSHNALALVARCVEGAHAPAPPVSLFHLAVHIRSGFEGLLIAVPPEHWPDPVEGGVAGLVERLPRSSRRIDPERVAASKRGPKCKVPKGCVDAKTARAHVAPARVMAEAELAPRKECFLAPLHRPQQNDLACFGISSQHRGMDSLSSLAGGFGLQLSLIVAVGAQNTYVLRQGLRREHVGAVVAFCALADAALTAAGVAGLGAALGRVPWLTPALTAGGAAFLLWYGGSALRRALRPGALAADLSGGATPLGAALSRVAGFTLLNPHVYLDTVLLVGAVGAAHAAADRPGFVLGAAAASAAWFAALGYGARLLAPAFARPAAWRVLDAVVAAVMLVLAAGLGRRALGWGG